MSHEITPRSIPGDPDAVIDEALKNAVFPGIACQVIQAGKTIYRRIAGNAENQARIRRVQDDSLWDLASLTKGMSTAAILLRLMEQESINANTPLGKLLPEVGEDLASISLHHLLCHTSGLPPVPEMFRQFDNGNDVDTSVALNHLYGLKPVSQVGQVVYSCTGYILLGKAAEHIGGAPLDKLLGEMMTGPAAVTDLGYNPADRERAVSEEYDPWRGRWLQGEVHDENAWTLGGVSGNAGLFASLDALVAYTEMFRRGGTVNGKPLISEAQLDLMSRRQTPQDTYEARTYGFASSYPEIFAGPGFSDDAFGHTGFTGTSFWIDPRRDLCIIILTNRVHPGRDHTLEGIKEFRRNFHRIFL